jgi:hypothetical protein
LDNKLNAENLGKHLIDSLKDFLKPMNKPNLNTICISACDTTQEQIDALQKIWETLKSGPSDSEKESLKDSDIELLNMSLPLSRGTKGRLKSSGQEFEIINTTSATSIIRFRFSKEEHEILDSDLRDEAEEIQKFSDEE